MKQQKDNQDEGLKGNEKIEEAIQALQQELGQAQEQLQLYQQENGQLIVAVEPSIGQEQLKLQAVQTSDGKTWWCAFTSFEEELKGADTMKSTFLSDIGKLFQTALTVPEIEGIIINPWNRTIMLDKKLIRIIMPYN